MARGRLGSEEIGQRRDRAGQVGEGGKGAKGKVGLGPGPPARWGAAGGQGHEAQVKARNSRQQYNYIAVLLLH